MTNRLIAIRHELEDMVEREAMRLFRLARRAEAKGCSAKLVNDIREEAFALDINYKSYPERLLDWRTKNILKYAFCSERAKHTYLTVNGNGEIINIERR